MTQIQTECFFFLRTDVRSRDPDGMLSLQELESLRRSNAMAPLSPSRVSELIEACTEMAKERASIRSILSELPSSFADVRSALNQLQRIVGDEA